MLHDIVEDHPLKVINGSLLGDEYSVMIDSEDVASLGPRAQQERALSCIQALFSSETAEIVAAVTNLPAGQQPADYEDKLRGYVQKVGHAVELPKAWLVKFADWCDNGLGIDYDIAGQGTKRAHFKRKYSAVTPVLQARSYDPDIQILLSDNAKVYVAQRFVLAGERLRAG